MKKDALYRKGMKTRREVLGAGREAAIVREEDEFSTPLRIFTTRYVWGEFWSGKGLPRKTRSLLVLAMMCAANRPHELRIHLRGALANGCTQDEIREVLLQVAIYCGIPASLDAHNIAMEVFAEAK